MADIRVIQGDLSEQEVDAIVNAANNRMLGGGGVDGAIHEAAGPCLKAACVPFPKESDGRTRCPTGMVRVTPAFNLPSKFVFHTVGPVFTAYKDPHDAHDLLRSCVKRCLLMATAMGLKSIAFPAISTGAYAFPVDMCASICKEIVDSRDWGFDITFVIFTDDDFATWSDAFGQ